MILFFVSIYCFVLKLAANRFVAYWDKQIEILGPEKVFLPLTLNEALNDNHVAILIRCAYVTGQNDPDCHGVVFIDYSMEGTAKYESLSLVRVIWYVLYTALQDLDSQKKGIVFN